ncbi:MAG: DUF2207 domain-containing protein, partial [Candidatus Methanoperedens sp.]|nr:DUF2207 domain-containing protein [Candidatus Methanoperedens sp.]
MNENKEIVILLIAVAFIGLAGLYLTGGLPGMENACGLGGCGDVYVNSYSANLYLNGTLEENFVYEIKEPFKYRMLYRDWKVPLSYGIIDEPAMKTNPHIELVSISSPPGTFPYIKDFQGTTKVISNAEAQYANEISSLAEQDEAGSYNPGTFDAGQYEISYVFRLHPPLECDKDYCHLNLKLADEHLPYNKVIITIHDPQGYVSGLFEHSLMDVKKEGDMWIVRGKSPKDTLFEIELLLNPAISGGIEGFPKEVPEVKQRTLSANSKYSFFSQLSLALKGTVFLFPIMLAFVYYKFGKEKSFTVPKFLSFVPGNRKPWLVNLVFRKDPFDFDENGFYATLLDLDRREIVKIETGGEKESNLKMLGYKDLEDTKSEALRITLLKGHEAGEDQYEIKVLKFLEAYSKNNVFDTNEFKHKIEKLRNKITGGSSEVEYDLNIIRDNMNDVMKVPDKKAAKEFVMSGKKYTWMIFGFFILVLVVTSYFLSIGIYTSVVLLLQTVPPLFVSSSLFGRWKENYYKEKLEWDAFSTFLSDFASIKKYAPEDLKMWQDWRVYATTLGIGDKVVEAMKQLNIQIPEVHVVT